MNNILGDREQGDEAECKFQNQRREQLQEKQRNTDVKKKI